MHGAVRRRLLTSSNMGQPPVTPQPTHRVAQWLAGLKLAQMQRVLLLLALVATAAFGGLDTVDKQVTPFEPGEEFSDGEFTLTIERARLVDELKGTYASAKPGKVYLGVVATLRNDGTVPGRLRDGSTCGCPKEFVGAFRFRTVRRYKRSAPDSPSNWFSPGSCRNRW